MTAKTENNWWIFFFTKMTWHHLPIGYGFWEESALIALRIVLSFPALIVDLIVLAFVGVVIKVVFFVLKSVVDIIVTLAKTIIKSIFGKGLSWLIVIAVLFLIYHLWISGKWTAIFELIVRHISNYIEPWNL